MCLCTSRKKFRAHEDIRTLKAVLLNEETGEWRGIYQMNDKTFPTDEVITNKERKGVESYGLYGNSVEGGFFHSSTDMGTVEELKTLFTPRTMKKPGGFKPAILECIIPKGTECYADYYGNYASRKIKVIKQ